MTAACSSLAPSNQCLEHSLQISRQKHASREKFPQTRGFNKSLAFELEVAFQFFSVQWSLPILQKTQRCDTIIQKMVYDIFFTILILIFFPVTYKPVNRYRSYMEKRKHNGNNCKPVLQVGKLSSYLVQYYAR